MTSSRAEGATWAIASPHAAATEAGARAFERGGNAVDAALAAATTLAVVYPHMCGVGGDLFALVQLDDGRVIAVNSVGRAPSGVDPEALAMTHSAMPDDGPASVTAPGAVAGWSAVHALGARLSWREAFDAAITLSADGMRVAPNLEESLARNAGRLRGDQGMREVFLPGGDPPPAGASITQAALARTLEAIAAGGSDAFYRGALGATYADGLTRLGVPFGPGDLAGHRADLLSPLSVGYRDLHVSVNPPSSQGFVLLEMLSLIERLGIEPDPIGSDAGVLSQIARAAAADRDLHLADPDAMTVHPHTLLDEGHLAGLADEIREGTVPRSRVAHADGDTIALVTADARGHAVSLVQSLFAGFGSGILEPATGIVAQSRGACFTLERGHPNELVAGKRPAHTLMPVMAHRRGRLAAVAGTRGGYGQPQINATNLLRWFDLGMHPADAVAAPRWLVSGMERPDDTEPWAIVEPAVGEVARASLAAAGLRIEDLPGPSSSVGHAHLIDVSPVGFRAGADPRSDGAALAG